MRIFGNQSAIIEILRLLDKNFNNPWGCHKCKNLSFEDQENENDCNSMICDRFNKKLEKICGTYNYLLEIEYDGENIKYTKILYKDYPNSNILSGTVR